MISKVNVYPNAAGDFGAVPINDRSGYPTALQGLPLQGAIMNLRRLPRRVRTGIAHRLRCRSSIKFSAPLLACCLVSIPCAPLAGQAASVHRDWSKFPAVLELDTDQEVFVVGDPHGDYERLTTLLTGAKIVRGSASPAGEVSWNSGKSVVVFTGDYIDKWQQSMRVITLLRSLDAAASKAGGKIIILTGNHEAEFLAEPKSKKVQDFARELIAAGMVPADVAACKGDLGKFLCSLPFAARVNDWFFSHAGNTAGRSMKKLIADLQNGVDKDGFGTEELIGEDSLLEARLGTTPWFQLPSGADPKQTLAAFASALGVAHIVQGHQPERVRFADGVERGGGEMFQRYGLIFLEDTGMSRGVARSHGAVLRIPAGRTGEAFAICHDGTATAIWDKGANSNLGRIKPCGGK